jgi:hypothetical protein
MSKWTRVTRFIADNDADSFARINSEIDHEIQDTVEQDITQPLIEFFSKRIATTPVPQTLAEIISLSSHGSLPHMRWPLTPRFATSEVKKEQTTRQLRIMAEFALRIQQYNKRRQFAKQQEGALTPVAYLAQICHAITDTLCKPQPLYGVRTVIRGKLKQLLFNMQQKLHRRIVNLQKLTHLQQQALQTEGQPGIINNANNGSHTFLTEYEQLQQLEKKLIAQINAVSTQYRKTALKPVINCIKRHVAPSRPPMHNPTTCGMFRKKNRPTSTLTRLLADVNPPHERSRNTECTAARRTLVRTHLIPVEQCLAQRDTGPNGALTVATVDNIAKTLRTTLADSQALDRRYREQYRYHNPLSEGLTPPSQMTRAVHKSLKQATTVRNELESLYTQLKATRQALREKQPAAVATSIRAALH